MNLSDLLADAAERAPEKAALVHTSGTLSFEHLNDLAGQIAAGLRAAGLEPGDRVALAMGNVPRFAAGYFGVLRAGGVAVPLNAMLTVSEAAAVLADANPRALLGMPPFGELAAGPARAAGIDVVVAEDEWDRLLSAQPLPASSGGDDDLAVLAYTSGTTGEPKGAMLSHANLRANLDQQMGIGVTVGPDDVLLLALPLFHIFGLNVTLGLLALNAATGVLIERFEPVQTLEAIQEQRVTVLFGAPPTYDAWVNTPGADQYDLSSVRFAISGAAALSAETLDSFRAMFGVEIYEGYGLTETAPTLTSTRMTERPVPNSIGKPLPDVELRLVDDDFNDVELGDPGEIIVRGPNVFKGYWNRPEESARAFREGWFRTGDVAVRDEEGYLYIVDRKRDLIIVSGFNVFPSEVEAALTRLESVEEAAVVGVPHHHTGESVVAYVVLAEGARTTPDELKIEVAKKLARFKCPQRIEIVDRLPHLVTGKVPRRALRSESA